MDDASFDILLALAAKAVSEEQYHEVADDVELLDGTRFSEAHENRMKKLFAVQKRKRVLSFGRRAAVIALVLTSLLFAAVLTNPDVRAAIKNVFVEWFDGFAKFSSSDDTGEGSVFVPSYLPSGFEVASNESGPYISRTVFAHPDGREIDFEYVVGTAELGINTDGVDYETLMHENIEYHIFISRSDAEELNTIVWVDQGFLFNLSSFIDLEELRLIAFSIK